MRLPSISASSHFVKFRRKKSFLLLEILIGLVLIELVALPLLIKPIALYRGEIRALEAAEGERLADATFVEIKEKLLIQQIRWEELPKPEEKKRFSLPPTTLKIPGFESKKIERSFLLKCDKRREKEGPHGEVYRLLKVEVELSPYLKIKKNKKGAETPYKYMIAVKKLPV